MNILVTGGAGFIGSHLCERLVFLGHSVTVIDDLSSGYIKNLESCINLIDFHLSTIEQFDFDKLKNIQVVVHLAAQTSVPISIKNFRNSTSTNLLSTVKVIDFCIASKAAFLFASSAAVYGNLDIGDDNRDEIDLLSPYAVDKYSMECYARTAHHLYGLSTIGFRFFNVYGPRQDPSSGYSGVISIFCDRLLKNQEIKIFGGHQSRDFIFINDVIDVIEKGIKKSQMNKLFTIVNVLTGNSTTINSVAQVLIDHLNVKPNIVYLELPSGDPEYSNGTIEKLVNLFDIKTNQMISIKEGLIITIKDRQQSLVEKK